MTRPTTRESLLLVAAEKHTLLCRQIDEMTPEEQHRDFDFGPAFMKPEAHWGRDRNLRDVLVHLTSWHGLLLRWVTANQRGERTPFLPAPYSWRNYAPLNVGFRDAHAEQSFADAYAEYQASHASVIALIESFSDVELFEKQHFAWTGSTTLGSYCVSATSSHYEWALKKLRASRRGWRARQAAAGLQ